MILLQGVAIPLQARQFSLMLQDVVHTAPKGRDCYDPRGGISCIPNHSTNVKIYKD